VVHPQQPFLDIQARVVDFHASLHLLLVHEFLGSCVRVVGE
jgi:hypothetical protein